MTGKQKAIKNIRILTDLFFLNLSFLISASLAQSLQLLMTNNMLFLLLILLNITWFFSSSSLGVYDFPLASFSAGKLLEIIKALVIQALISIVFIFIFKELLFTRNFVLLYTLILFFFILAKEELFRFFIRYQIKRGYNLRDVIIIGGGEVGKNFFEMIKSNPELGYHPVGFIHDSSDDYYQSNSLGSTVQLEDILKPLKIDDAIITLPDYNREKFKEIIRICNKYAVNVHIIPDYFQFLSKKFSVAAIADFPVITLRSGPLESFQWRIIKRLFDLGFTAFISLTLLIWFIPLIILLQKIYNNGDVFFVQERIGKKNRIFRCYKFRTMHQSSVKSQDPLPVSETDSRVTPFGKFLRKSNIDELPQFLNVLIGDMSVVGPRPHAISFDEMYSGIVEEIRLRHTVKPGITGWAQIHGFRGDSADVEENRQRTNKRIQYDLWYIDNWNPGLDFRIILITIFQIFRGKARGV